MEYAWIEVYDGKKKKKCLMGHSEIPESIVNKFLNYNNSLQVLIIIIFL